MGTTNKPRKGTSPAAILGRIALATAAIIAGSPTAVSAKIENQSNQRGVTVNKGEAIENKVKSAKEIVVQSAGGFDVIGYSQGIPPKFYGQNFVRRGTHKRTNR